MSEVSGFDPLFSALSKMENVEAKSIFVNEVKPIQSSTIANFKPDRLQKLKRKLKLNANDSITNTERALPFKRLEINVSPFTQPIHELTFDNVYFEDEEQNYDLIFFSVAENQFCKGLFSAPAAFKRKTILFFHQPPSWHKLYWRDFNVLNDFKAIVVLSNTQKIFFESLISAPVVLIKHGVDLNFFTPDFNAGKPVSNQILFVGSWLRDFEMLFKVAFILKQKNIPFKLNCIIPRKDRENQTLLRLASFKEVEFYSELSVEELLGLYRSNDILFLPLIDSTANNGLNEAMACGLPIVATNIGGAKDYLGENSPFLANFGDAEDHAAKVINAFNWLGSNQNSKSEMRIRAERELDWLNISKELIHAILKLQ